MYLAPHRHYFACFLKLPSEVHYFYPHFTDEETEALKCSNLRVMQVIETRI